jgi:uncharacterized RDD family membrane protein YckC
MRCPACEHISTGDGVCPNCGFTSPTIAHESDGALEFRPPAAEPVGPLDDFALADPVTAPRGRAASSSGRSVSQAVRTGLPLFPQAEPPPPPRSSRSRPLSVRRQTPEIAKLRPDRVRPTPTAGSLQFEGEVTDGECVAAPGTTGDAFRLLGRRVAAGLLDGALLVGVNVAVLYLTLRLTGLSFAALTRLPFVPLVAFLLLIDLGYLVVLTAFGGQTIGQMTFGLRVEREDGGLAGLSQAVTRTAALAVALLPVGLGFAGLFVGRRRALHDRLADTRVVRIA